MTIAYYIKGVVILYCDSKGRPQITTPDGEAQQTPVTRQIDSISRAAIASVSRRELIFTNTNEQAARTTTLESSCGLKGSAQIGMLPLRPSGQRERKNHDDTRISYKSDSRGVAA